MISSVELHLYIENDKFNKHALRVLTKIRMIISNFILQNGSFGLINSSIPEGTQTEYKLH